MSIFGQLMSKILGKGPDKDGPIPGAMGRLLADMGIHELGPVRKGTPINVLMGCKKELVVIPGTDRPATRKDGTPIFAKDKHGKRYMVMDQYGVTKKQWKQMQNDQKRKAAGRWYSGKPAEAA
ncbi:MAG TPA: hypothetical protein VIG24_16930 [Acidimicrobiia bacterium]